MKRDEFGFPAGVAWRCWVDDPVAGVEVYVVDADHYLSYRAAGRKMSDPLHQREFEFINWILGIDPGREETALVRRGDYPTLVLLGDHRAAWAAVPPKELVAYHRRSPSQCPFAPKDEGS